MEPFGLFQILQNLLTPPSPSAENVAPSSSPEPEPQAPDERSVPSAPTRNAAAQFLENHEKRAGRSPSPKR